MPNLSIYLRLSPYALPSPRYNGKTVLPTTQGQVFPVSASSHALCSCNCPSFSCIGDYFPFLVNYFHQHTSTLYFFSKHIHTQSLISLLLSYSLLNPLHSAPFNLKITSDFCNANPNNQFFLCLDLLTARHRSKPAIPSFWKPFLLWLPGFHTPSSSFCLTGHSSISLSWILTLKLPLNVGSAPGLSPQISLSNSLLKWSIQC